MAAVVEEWTLQVPWGHIAGKTWGSPCNQRVLAIHGLSDNAASFDQLIPHLHNQLYVVCVDLPGHGHSSHFPAGVSFSLLDYACSLKRVVDHLQWSQFVILAHSFGSHVAIYFTALFENIVTRLLMIDVYIGFLIPGDEFVIERCQSILDKMFEYKNNENKIYSYEESLDKIREGRVTGLGLQSAKALQKRAFKKTIKGFIHNNDRRLKLLQYPVITSNLHFNLIKDINCQTVAISSSECEPFLWIMSTKSTLEAMQNRLGNKMRVIRVQGSHDVHMDNPETVVPIIKSFFIQNCSL